MTLTCTTPNTCERKCVYPSSKLFVQSKLPDYQRLNEDVRQIEITTREIAESRQTLFAAKKDAKLKELCLHTTSLGATLMDILIKPVFKNDYLHAIRDENPYVDCFLRNVTPRRLHHLPRVLDVLDPFEISNWVSILNGFVNAIKTEVNSSQFQKLTADHRLTEESNYSKL